MEEDVGVKAPVTRLRHRLSVEQSEDVSSPLTPTKKRGGRLAAIPQLQLIGENAQVSSPRKTRRKSVVKDIADAEEKPVTPSRRSTRIKSNTSIVSETLSAQTTGSPRAKRALRRNSQAGSDNEGPATPARTRRTRKDSASSVENQEPAPIARTLQVAEMVIAEEPENEIQKPANEPKSSPPIIVEDSSPNSALKSKLLSKKINRRSGSYKSDLDTSMTSEGNNGINTTKKEKQNSETKAKLNNQLNKSVENIELTDKLSESNKSLLKSLNTEVNQSNHNKSASDLNTGNTETKKRNRCESWPSVTITSANNTIVFSDNELSKKKKKKSLINFSNSDLENTSTKEDNIDFKLNEKDNLQTILDSNSKRRKSEKSFTAGAEKITEVIRTEDSLSTTEKTISKPESNDIVRDIAMLFESTSSVQAVLYFEDSNSDSANTETVNKIQQLDSEDQCVPIVKHDIEFEDKSTILNSNEVVFPNQIIEKECIDDIGHSKKTIDNVNDSCEPMDIDETIHEDVLHISQNSLHKSLAQDTSNMEQPNKSKRKSSSSISASDTLDRSKNENKSTLILSEIKDESVTSEKSLKSPKATINVALSKSINTTANTQNIVPKTNLSLNDIKGTPLKQNNVQKLTMQTSTPITTQTSDKMKIEEKHVNSEQNNSDFSKSIDEDCDEPTKPKSKYIDSEAEEASDDYESGDSRDEEERQYEEENEIIVRGETLGSEDDVSNDTDYEKDSFVVSSDGEDNELLSGSGEDLSISDNELTMSKKSKKKYNERKLKEQKNASREMFESRHKLNTSEQKSTAPKTKNNRMRIDSSLLESDEEVVVKTKNNKRLRLDSTLDTSAKQENANKSLNKSNEKANKSISDQSNINENEITVCNDTPDEKDPLLVEFKKEPKTPQKDLNISVVQFTATQEIENVEVAESNSILNQTKTDPLLATMTHDDSDSSESEELLQNYDLVLDELNKNKKSKLTNNNISLNLGNKNKHDKAVPIIDQLNLTNTKKLKKAQNIEAQDVVDSTTKTSDSPQEKQDSDGEESSNSIDLQLLLSEDNCGSGDEIDRNEQQKKGDDGKMFVPLRKSQGKTNIRESMDMNTSQQNTAVNESGKKKKKRESSIMLNESIAETEDFDKPVMNDSIKKKNRKTSLSVVISQSVDEPQDSNKPDLNESIKKKNRKSSITTHPVEETQDSKKPSLNESIKKKNRNSSVTIEPLEMNTSVLNESIKKKQRKTSLVATESSDQPQGSQTAGEGPELNKSYTKKNKKRSSLLAETEVEVQEKANEEEIVLNESTKKKKKRKSSLVTEAIAEPEGDFFFIDTTGAVASDKETHGIEKPLEILPASAKKKKKNKNLDISQNIMAANDDDDSDGAPVEILYRSEKACNPGAEQNTVSEGNTESVVTISGKKKKKNKKKKSVDLNQSGENAKTEDVSLNNSKKRKRKSSDTGVPQESLSQDAQEITENGTLNESLSGGSHKKKPKMSHNDGASEQNQVEAENVPNDEKRSRKKKKNLELPVSFQDIPAETETIQTEVKKSKKRKERDEDNDSKKTKVSKENSFQEVHLPTLPASILNQLEDKPKKVAEKNKVVSTSKFIVENSRQKRAKPSNYLEESVYLDAASPLVKKGKPRMKIPKVLPFIPTASISDSGFTTNFKINKVSHSVQFVAEPAAGISFSKELYLAKDKLKRLGTYDHYKKQIHKKLSKF